MKRLMIVAVGIIATTLTCCDRVESSDQTVYDEVGRLVDMGRYPEAIETLESGIPSDHRDAHYHRLRGILFQAWRPNRYAQQAIDSFLAALEEFPDDYVVLVSLGAALLQDGQPERATSYLRRAVDQFDRDELAHVEPYGLMAEAKYELKKYESALASVEKSLEINPQNARMQLLKGLILSHIDGVGSLVEQYNIARQLAPQKLRLHRMYGYRLIEMEELEPAIDHFSALLNAESGETRPWAAAGLGTALYLSGDYEAAAVHFRHAQSQSRKSPETLELLSFWRWARRDEEEALDLHGRYLRETATAAFSYETPTRGEFVEHYRENPIFDAMNRQRREE